MRQHVTFFRKDKSHETFSDNEGWDPEVEEARSALQLRVVEFRWPVTGLPSANLNRRGQVPGDTPPFLAEGKQPPANVPQVTYVWGGSHTFVQHLT